MAIGHRLEKESRIMLAYLILLLNQRALAASKSRRSYTHLIIHGHGGSKGVVNKGD